MKFLVIYDISSNSARLKVSEYCKDFGLVRVQKSAFSGEITTNNAQMLELKCKEAELGEDDCVYLIPCCDSCFLSKMIIGKLDEESLEKKELLVVG